MSALVNEIVEASLFKVWNLIYVVAKMLHCEVFAIRLGNAYLTSVEREQCALRSQLAAHNLGIIRRQIKLANAQVMIEGRLRSIHI